jgi:hypothetical protein
MSADLIAALAAGRVLGPRSQFAQLAHDHVAFDQLVGRPVFETAALRTVTGDTACVAVRGPVGAGKSSLIAAVCARLPEHHIALRVPVAGADDPTSVSVLAALTLSTALSAIDLERYEREALDRARADSSTESRTPANIGGKLGGGPIPAELHAELGTLTEELQTNRLAGERLAGLDRLVTTLLARGLAPIFVLEDTEAAVGGRDRRAVIDAFFAGPIAAFMREVGAASLIAVQDELADSPEFRRLAPSMQLIDVPPFDDAHAVEALKAIAAHRLAQHDPALDADTILGADALEVLVAFYDETNRNLRLTLAALQSSLEHAADIRAERVRAGHVRLGTQEWRTQLER